MAGGLPAHCPSYLTSSWLALLDPVAKGVLVLQPGSAGCGAESPQLAGCGSAWTGQRPLCPRPRNAPMAHYCASSVGGRWVSLWLQQVAGHKPSTSRGTVGLQSRGKGWVAPYPGKHWSQGRLESTGSFSVCILINNQRQQEESAHSNVTLNTTEGEGDCSVQLTRPGHSPWLRNHPAISLVFNSPLSACAGPQQHQPMLRGRGRAAAGGLAAPGGCSSHS